MNLLVFFEKKQKLKFLNNPITKKLKTKQKSFSGLHLFLHYGWFLQNFGKEDVRTNMHTTVGKAG